MGTAATTMPLRRRRRRGRLFANLISEFCMLSVCIRAYLHLFRIHSPRTRLARTDHDSVTGPVGRVSSRRQ